MRFQKLGVLVGVLALLVATGCAKPPVAEKAAAENAMTAAVTAGAEQYMTADLDAAKKVLADAETAMTSKKYDVAKTGYAEAQAAFEKVAAGVEPAKQAMITENAAAIDAMDIQWKELADKAKKLGKKMSKEDKAALTTDEPAIVAAIQAAKDGNAANPVEAKNQIATAKTLVDKWAGVLNK